jgi:hypothetical protein
MKLTLLSAFVALIAVGCMKTNNIGQLSPSQLSTVAELKSDYQNAKLYNDSLMWAVSNSTSSMIHYFDSRYHYYDSEFDNCHSRYEHNYVSADHSHNSIGVVQMHASQGGMMNECQCCSNGGHEAKIHQQMDALHELHTHYHP